MSDIIEGEKSLGKILHKDLINFQKVVQTQYVREGEILEKMMDEKWENFTTLQIPAWAWVIYQKPFPHSEFKLC